jgi:hypothetical protein
MPNYNNKPDETMQIDDVQSVVNRAIQVSLRCGVGPRFIFKEIILASASFKQDVDEDKYSPIKSLLALVGKTCHMDFEGNDDEGIREFPIDRIDAFADDARNNLCRIQIKEAIDSLVRKGIHDQIIFDSLLQEAIDYGVTITCNPNILTSHLLEAISDLFDIMGGTLFPWEVEAVEM